MTDPNYDKHYANQIIDQLPAYVKQRLLEIARQHGKNRHAMRASRVIIARALKEKVRDELRRTRQQAARALKTFETITRLRIRAARGDDRPLPGMTEDRRVHLLGIE